MQIYATVRRCRISERDVSWRFKTLMDRNDSFYTRRLMMVDVGSWFRLCSLSSKINQNLRPRTIENRSTFTSNTDERVVKDLLNGSGQATSV